jgi:hypothetical protein
LLTACGERPPSDAAEQASVAADSASVAADRAEPHADPARPGIRFDPSQLQPGDTIGVLVAESVAAERTIVDSSYVGVARFSGEAEITGWTMRHFESDMRDVSMCFEADSASAATLPRWSQDERRPWFCFENETEARRELGAPSDSVPARIVIDRFTIHRGLSDQVNSARLVRVIRD